MPTFAYSSRRAIASAQKCGGVHAKMIRNSSSAFGSTLLVTATQPSTGAAPPVLGWVAVTNSIDPNALLLFLIIFAWTPPHFWALAIARREEYAKVGVPMLPVAYGVELTRLHILLYTVLLALVTVLPWLTGMSGFIYLLAAAVLNAVFLGYAWQLYRTGRSDLPMRTFRWSISYLGFLFAALLIDHYWRIGA